MNYQILKTVICNDCMNGQHEVIGHSDCECVCHNNPQCFVCGHNLLIDIEIKESAHMECLMQFNDDEHDRYLDQMITKYGREAI